MATPAPTPSVKPLPVSALIQLNATVSSKNIFLAAYVVLLYDYFLQLPEETAQIWWKRKSFVSYIYLFLRYYSLLAASIVCVGYFSPLITGPICAKWGFFVPFGFVLPFMFGSGLLMSLRIFALYNKSKILLILLLSILFTHLSYGIWMWSVKGSFPTPVPAIFDNFHTHYCTPVPSLSLGSISSGYAFLELSFDAICFALTLARPFWGRFYLRESWGTGGSWNGLFRHLLEKGALYFGVIFSANLAWALMVLYSGLGLRASGGGLSSMLMVTIISRITLKLRSASESTTPFSSQATARSRSDRTDETVGESGSYQLDTIKLGESMAITTKMTGMSEGMTDSRGTGRWNDEA